ncbi:hypothetical protein [Oceanobacillus oncorhynchi]|uniref:hypothetical protein n=1 Tax=Oceanobacillus oncorhynchi TaxID=545501 RepID=UPI0018691710|nr:hypothetical protein [Oceanobacillus oncorhynchi]MDM8100225.1 hypothetical protein [Oceanobacillus oncorhynchi]
MGAEVLTQSVEFNKEQIESSFKRLHPHANFIAERIVYYPYYYFCYNVKAKRLFLPLNEKVGCAIDSISGKGSLIDYKPKWKAIEISKEQQMPEKYSLKDCTSISESFIYRSLSLKMRMISFPELKREQQQRFYRPYWVVWNERDGSSDFIVDGVSGQFHPM